jgi:hypothetical protein
MPTVYVPHLSKRVYKSTIIKEFNDQTGIDRLSADRLIRYTTAKGISQETTSIRAVDEWSIRLLDDVAAIKFDLENTGLVAEYGRIIHVCGKKANTVGSIMSTQ